MHKVQRRGARAAMLSAVVDDRYRQRFYSRCEPDPNSGCWLWFGASRSGGYGRVVTPFRSAAHRMSYLISKGKIPDGLLVRHKCDTPACVNPDHLLLGTDADNVRDRDERGRTSRHHGRKGEANNHSALTEQDVREIRRCCAAGATITSVGRDFGISFQAVSKIVNRQRWAHVE